jgi:ketosteroid isomerase-like protein
MKTVAQILLVLAVAASAVAQDDTSSETVSKIITMERAWNQAFKVRDTSAIKALLDDTVVLVNDDGSLQTKTQFVSWIQASHPSDEEQVFPESLDVHVSGDVAIATGTFKAKGIENGKNFVRKDRFIDTWVRKHGTWVCVSASATPVLH